MTLKHICQVLAGSLCHSESPSGSGCSQLIFLEPIIISVSKRRLRCTKFDWREPT